MLSNVLCTNLAINGVVICNVNVSDMLNFLIAIKREPQEF